VGGGSIYSKMMSITIIKHKELSFNTLIDIIELKSKAWGYSFCDQIEWIRNNMRDNDLHILLKEGDENMAYLNLVDIDIIIDNNVLKCYGIGNVCSSEKGKGYGSKIINLVNQYIIKSNRVGLLFCKSTLVPFYQKNSWKVVNKDKLKLPFDNIQIETMMFQMDKIYSEIIYTGRKF